MHAKKKKKKKKKKWTKMKAVPKSKHFHLYIEQ